MGPKDYFFLKTPIPVARTKRLTRLQKDVWSAVFTLREIYKGRSPTVKQIARLVTDGHRQRTRSAISELESLGLLETNRKRRRGMNLLDVRELWPRWLEEEGEEYLLRNAEGRRNFPFEGGSDTPNEKEDEEIKRGTPWVPGGGLPRSPQRGDSLGPPFKSIKSSIEDTRAEVSTSAPGWKRLTEDPGGETGRRNSDSAGGEVLVGNPDGDSREETERAERAREERKTARTAGRRKVRPPSPPELLERPSERWEFLAHKRKDVPSWSGRDLVGYWVVRFREVFGREDEEFFVDSAVVRKVDGTPNRFVARCSANARTFVGKYLEGKTRRGKELIDAILERAVERGRPVSFAYYFTPSKPEAAMKILSSTGWKPRKKTLSEVNDECGADRDLWKRRAREQMKRWEAAGNG